MPLSQTQQQITRLQQSQSNELERTPLPGNGKYDILVSQSWTLSRTIPASSKNQNFIVLSGSLTLALALSKAWSRAEFQKGSLKNTWENSEPWAGTGNRLCCLCACGLRWLDWPVLSLRHKPAVMHTLQKPLRTHLTFIRAPTWLRC